MIEGGATTARRESSASALSHTAAQQQLPRKPLKSRPSMATEKKGVEGASTATVTDGAASKGGASRSIAPARAEAVGVKPSPRRVTASATRSAVRSLKGIETADGKNADAGVGSAAPASATRPVPEPVVAVPKRHVQVALEWVYGCQYATCSWRKWSVGSWDWQIWALDVGSVLCALCSAPLVALESGEFLYCAAQLAVLYQPALHR